MRKKNTYLCGTVNTLNFLSKRRPRKFYVSLGFLGIIRFGLSFFILFFLNKKSNEYEDDED